MFLQICSSPQASVLITVSVCIELGPTSLINIPFQWRALALRQSGMHAWTGGGGVMFLAARAFGKHQAGHDQETTWLLLAGLLLGPCGWDPLLQPFCWLTFFLPLNRFPSSKQTSRPLLSPHLPCHAKSHLPLCGPPGTALLLSTSTARVLQRLQRVPRHQRVSRVSVEQDPAAASMRRISCHTTSGWLVQASGAEFPLDGGVRAVFPVKEKPGISRANSQGLRA